MTIKSTIAKIAAFVLFTAFFCPAVARQPQVNAKTSAEKIKEAQANKAADVIKNITSVVSITDEQAAKLRVSLLESIIKYDNARSGINGDASKLRAWSEAKTADIMARIKSILTASQYEQVANSHKLK